MTIERFESQPAAAVPALLLLDRTTDSWTAVLESVVQLANNIANTEFVPKDMRGSVPKVAAAILYSRELGLPPMTGLAGVHVINGRPGIYAEMMRALILQTGHELRVVETSVARCRMRGRRKGVDDWTEVTYTMEEAKAAGDYQKNPNYRSRPADMLVARCTTRLARLEFSDVIHGLRSVEELQDLAGDLEVVDADGVVTAAVSAETTTVQRASRASRGSVVAAPVGEDAVQGPDPGPTARRRRELPRRGAVQAPQTTEEDTRVEQPAQEPAPVPAEEQTHQADVKPLSARVRGAVGVLVQHFDRLGITERQARLEWTALLSGRTISSSSDLQLAEVTDVIRKIEKLPDFEALVALGQELEDAERGDADDAEA